MNDPSTRSHFPRLDILDSIFVKYLDRDFLDFALKHEHVDALIAIGLFEIGVTRPSHDIDAHFALELRAQVVVDDWINLKMKENEDG